MIRPRDVILFSGRALSWARVRTLLMLLAMAIGVASVILLTALGEGARLFVTGQFSSLGTNLLIVLPGRSETKGGPPPLLGETPRPLTLDDAQAVLRSHAVRAAAPLVVGRAPVSRGRMDREVSILGTSASFFSVRHLSMQRGSFLPEAELTRAQPVCVLGASLAQELFRGEDPLGTWLRIGANRFRVIGILAQQGVSIGVDLDDIAMIPVASAQALFNTDSLFRIMLEARDRDSLERAREAVRAIIRDRHEGEDDLTVITQDAVLSAFDRILMALTLAVGGIAAISLAVAGILIMNVMLVAVSQRAAEIGLLKALGAPPRQILLLFLVEAASLSLLGALFGTGIGYGGSFLLARALPDFPITVPLWALAAGIGVALGAGLGFGLLPARRAARLHPVAALARR